MRWAFASLLALGGCATVPVGQTTCNADNWQEFIGQPEAAIYGALANLRVIRDGDAVTQDFNPDRLNVEVGADGKITRFACY